MTTAPPGKPASAGSCFEPGAAATLTLAGGTQIPVADATVWITHDGQTPGWRGVPDLLTPAQVAEKLHCGVWKVYDLHRSGEIRGTHVGKVLFHPDDVLAYIDSHRDKMEVAS